MDMKRASSFTFCPVDSDPWTVFELTNQLPSLWMWWKVIVLRKSWSLARAHTFTYSDNRLLNGWVYSTYILNNRQFTPDNKWKQQLITLLLCFKENPDSEVDIVQSELISISSDEFSIHTMTDHFSWFWISLSFEKYRYPMRPQTKIEFN